MRFLTKKWTFLFGSAFFLAPAVAFAQQLQGIRGLLNSVVGIVNVLIPLAMALAVLAFFWGLVKYIFNASDAAKTKEGKTLMIWGVIALAVMVGIWGIIQFIAGNLGISTGGTVVPPTVQTSQY